MWRTIIALVLALTSVGLSALPVMAATWSTKTSMPAARAWAASAVIGGTLYVAGGHDGAGGSTTLQAYNPATNSWSTLAPMPGRRYLGDGAGVINGELYVAGGWNYPDSGLPQSTLFVYNPGTNSWSSKASMPTLSGDGASGVISGKLYVTTAANGLSGYRDYLHVYDPAANTWSQLASSPNVHDAPAFGVIGSKFYVAGGGDANGTPSDKLDVYNQATNTWTTKAPIPAAGRGFASAVRNGKLYVIGGHNTAGVSLNTVYVYDPASDAWSTETAMSTARYGAAAGVINGVIYVAGGSNSSGTLATVEALTESLSWSTATLSQARIGLSGVAVGNKALFAGGDIGNNIRVTTVDIYDATTGAWSTATLSQARSGPATATLGNKAFFAGGYGPPVYSNVVDIYDVTTSAWSTATLSQARYGLAGAAVGNKVLFAGGFSASSSSNVVDIYDATTGAWSTATLSQARGGAAAAVVGNKAFFAGGWTGGSISNVVDIYDATTGAWSTATLSQARTGVAAAVVGNKALFASGGTGGSGVSNVVDIYDAATGAWSTATLSQARTGVAAAVVGNKAFFAGGGTGNGVSNVVDIYDATTGAWSTATLSQARTGVAAAVVGNKALFAGGDNTGNWGFSNVVDIADLQSTTTTWTRQFGSSNYDFASGVAGDGAGNAYVVGYTRGALPGQTALGGADAFIRKHDSAGTEVRTSQFGTNTDDLATGVAGDGAGNAYVVGYTSGALPGQVASGLSDAFIRKYDTSGTEVWTSQFGTNTDDFASGAAVDGAGNAYVVGYTAGALPGQTASGGYDAFIRKYDTSGTAVWTSQFGTNTSDVAYGVAGDGAGNTYVVGYTFGALPGQTASGGADAFIRKYDTSGTAVWTSQFGTNTDDFAYGVAGDGAGNAYVVGHTYGALPGQTASGGYDAFIRKYDTSGTAVWTSQFGTNTEDAVFSVAGDGAGNAYVVGYTSGALPGQASSGLSDAFIRKYDSFGGTDSTTSTTSFTITASAGANGTISPSGAVVVNQGVSQSFTITPSSGYHIADVLADGSSVGAVSSYTFSNVTANHTIVASFAINTFTVTASAGANGTISPSGAVVVNQGVSQSFTITPNTGYHVADVLADGSSVGAVASYTFTNITANHTIAASFVVTNQAPFALFTYLPAEPKVNQKVTFNASASFDSDGSIVSYSWNFGDGGTGIGVTVEHTYTNANQYSVILTVTDNSGATDAKTTTVTVAQAATTPTTSGRRSLPDPSTWAMVGSGLVVFLFYIGLSGLRRRLTRS